MWPQNALTERLNIRWPILQAPMGWLSTPALAAAVSNVVPQERLFERQNSVAIQYLKGHRQHKF
jgi:hypothetical protein